MVAKLRALKSLELQFCWHLTDEGLVHLQALTSLAHLDIMYCWQVRA